MPQLLDLLQEPATPVTRSMHMVRPTGDTLDLGRTAADQHLRDGEVVRLLRADDVPPPAEVADVTEVVGDELADRPDLWTPRTRVVAGGIALAVLGFLSPGFVRVGDVELLVGVGIVAALAVAVGQLGSPARRSGAGPRGCSRRTRWGWRPTWRHGWR